MTMSLETQTHYKPEMITPASERVPGQRVVALFGTTHEVGMLWRERFTEGFYGGGHMDIRCFNPRVEDWKEEYAKREAQELYSSEIIVSYITNSSPDSPGRSQETNGSIGSITELLSLAKVAIAQEKKLFVGFETLNTLESSITSPEGRACLAMTLEALDILKQRYPHLIYCNHSITPVDLGRIVSESMNKAPELTEVTSPFKESLDVVVLEGYSNELPKTEGSEFIGPIQRSKLRFTHIKSQALLADLISMRVLREQARKRLGYIKNAGVVLLRQDNNGSYQLDNQVASQFAECIGKCVSTIETDSTRKLGVLPQSLHNIVETAGKLQSDFDGIVFERDVDTILNVIAQTRQSTDIRHIEPSKTVGEFSSASVSKILARDREVTIRDSGISLAYNPYSMGIPFVTLRAVKNMTSGVDLVTTLVQKTVSDYRREQRGKDGEVKLVKTEAQRAQALLDGHSGVFNAFLQQKQNHQNSDTIGRYIINEIPSLHDELLLDVDSHFVKQLQDLAVKLQNLPDSMNNTAYLEVLMPLMGSSAEEVKQTVELLHQMLSGYEFQNDNASIGYKTDVEFIAQSQDANGNPSIDFRKLRSLWYTYFSLTGDKIDSSLIIAEIDQICRRSNISTDKLFCTIIAAMKFANMRIQKEIKEAKIKN